LRFVNIGKRWAGRRPSATRHAPYADLGFTDEEVVTIYLFAVAMEEKRQIKAIHTHARRYWRDWFPKLPGYGAYVQ